MHHAISNTNIYKPGIQALVTDTKITCISARKLHNYYVEEAWDEVITKTAGLYNNKSENNGPKALKLFVNSRNKLLKTTIYCHKSSHQSSATAKMWNCGIKQTRSGAVK